MDVVEDISFILFLNISLTRKTAHLTNSCLFKRQSCSILNFIQQNWISILCTPDIVLITVIAYEIWRNYLRCKCYSISTVRSIVIISTLWSEDFCESYDETIENKIFRHLGREVIQLW